jgi:hypothetical protein
MSLENADGLQDGGSERARRSGLGALGKNMLKLNDLERVLVEKVIQLFRNTL